MGLKLLWMPIYHALSILQQKPIPLNKDLPYIAQRSTLQRQHPEAQQQKAPHINPAMNLHLQSVKSVNDNWNYIKAPSESEQKFKRSAG